MTEERLRVPGGQGAALEGGMPLAIGRRQVLAGAGAVAATLAAGLGRPAAAAGSLRIAALKFGSLNWLLETIRAEGLDAKTGVKLSVLEVATNQAGPIALLAGEVDIIVSDWTWAMRQRSLGDKVRFAPYSSSLGALMVPKDTPAKGLKDLAGKRLGVAGTAIDKSWLVLRAYSRKTLGKDIADLASPVYGAAPLVTEEMRNGRLDAVLNFWTYAARLSASGFVPLMHVADLLKELGIDPVPPLVGFIWREGLESTHGPALAAFLDAAARGNAVLRESDAAWERIRGLVKPASDAELAALKSYYRAGIPRPWTEAETRSAEKLMNLLVEQGDKELLGSGTSFDAKLFHAAAK